MLSPPLRQVTVLLHFHSGVPPCVNGSPPTEIHTEVVNAYAQAMAPTFLYLVPIAALGFVISLFLRDRRLSTEAGLVARGEATGISTVQEPSSDQTAPAER